jgi:UMF1 family MFS transporter
MYDFASSGYTTVVITAVFNAYFVAVVGGVALGNARLDGDVVPVLRADRPHGPAPRRHRRRLRLEEAAAGGDDARLRRRDRPALVRRSRHPGSDGRGSDRLQLGVGTGQNLIAALLPEVAGARAMGRVSGWGWSLGYVGGLLGLGLAAGVAVTAAHVLDDGIAPGGAAGKQG